jgi:hypothetical protein
LRPQPQSSTLVEAMKTYKRSLASRLINWWFRTLTQLGLGAPYRQILTVPGAEDRTTALDAGGCDRGGRTPLAGRRLWTRELGAQHSGAWRGHAEARWPLRDVQGRGSRSRDAIPVLRKYIDEIRVTRPYFDATPSSSDAAVAAELPRHPVFRLIPIQ